MDALATEPFDEERHVSGRLVRREALTEADRDAMHGLLASYFAGVERAVFERDLDEKQWAILLERGDGTLAGFTTLLLYRTGFQGETITVVFSGDTIVDRASWGSAALHRTWIAAVTRLAAEHGEGRLFWQLIVSGFRTYRLLPIFFREFYPRHDRDTPPETRALMDELAVHRFGRQYDRARGVVRFEATLAAAVVRPAVDLGLDRSEQ